MSESQYEYRVVPKAWNYLSKVHRYQNRASYEHNGAGYPRDGFRHERRLVSDWEEIEEGDDE